MSSAAISPFRRRWLVVLALIVAVAGFELYVSWLALHPAVSDNYRAYYIDQTTTCLDKPVTGRYVLGQTVSFLPDDSPAAWQLRVCGWDGPAGDGTHSVGTRSMLRFATSGATGDLILRLQMTAIMAPDSRAQHIAVSGNGVLLGETTIADSVTKSVDFAVPQSVIDAGQGRLDIALDYATATEMTPNDSDTHYRSIKLLSLQLRSPGDPPSDGAQDDPVAQRNHKGPD